MHIMIRGNNGYYSFDKTDISPLASYSVNWNFPKNIEAREKSEASVLYYYYHYNGLVRIEGKKSERRLHKRS